MASQMRIFFLHVFTRPISILGRLGERGLDRKGLQSFWTSDRGKSPGKILFFANMLHSNHYKQTVTKDAEIKGFFIYSFFCSLQKNYQDKVTFI